MHAFISKKSTFPIVVIYLMHNWNKTQKILRMSILELQNPHFVQALSTLRLTCQIWDSCTLNMPYQTTFQVVLICLWFEFESRNRYNHYPNHLPVLFPLSFLHIIVAWVCPHDWVLQLPCFQFPVCGNHVEWCSSPSLLHFIVAWVCPWSRTVIVLLSICHMWEPCWMVQFSFPCILSVIVFLI